MDQFLSLIGMQAVKLAVRSGIAVTSSYALQQYANFIQTVDDEKLNFELKTLQFILDSKIKVITPAIDLIELKSGQGNGALESASPLATSMQRRIISLGHQTTALARLQTDHPTIQRIIKDIKDLIHLIDSSIPLLQLAISASGETLSSALPVSVSPSRMLQASGFLMIADSQFAANPHKPVQVGPDFIVSIYMIFKGYSLTCRKETPETGEPWYSEVEYIRKPVWQEVLHKARLRLHRVPILQVTDYKPDAEPRNQQKFLYRIEISEDRNDGRAHCDYSSPNAANLADSIPAAKITKLFYTNSASILNIKDDSEASDTPILLIKRVPDTSSPRNNCVFLETPDNVQCSVDNQLFEESRQERREEYTASDDYVRYNSTQFPSYLDPEWIALEMYSADESATEDNDEMSEAETEESDVDSSQKSSKDGDTADAAASPLKSLSLYPRVDGSGDSQTEDVSKVQANPDETIDAVTGPFSAVTTSLSLLELVIRLAVLQETQQQSHLSVPDHMLSHFLSGQLQPKNVWTRQAEDAV